MSIPIILVVGKTGLSITENTGSFFCPVCTSESKYKKKGLWVFVTLFWIPVLPCYRVTGYVKCSRCRSKFEPTVLEYSKAVKAKAREDCQNRSILFALWQQAMLKVMIRVMLADGHVDEAEVASIQDVFAALSDQSIDRATVSKMATEMELEGSIQSDLTPFTPSLSNEGKLEVLKAMCYIALADGEVHEDERKLIDAAADILEINGEVINKILQTPIRRNKADEDLQEGTNNGTTETKDPMSPRSILPANPQERARGMGGKGKERGRIARDPEPMNSNRSGRRSS